MITEEIRKDKEALIEQVFQDACVARHEGRFSNASRSAGRLVGLVDAFIGIDSDLFWLASKRHDQYCDYSRSGVLHSDEFALREVREALGSAA